MKYTTNINLQPQNTTINIIGVHNGVEIFNESKTLNSAYQFENDYRLQSEKDAFVDEVLLPFIGLSEAELDVLAQNKISEKEALDENRLFNFCRYKVHIKSYNWAVQTLPALVIKLTPILDKCFPIWGEIDEITADRSLTLFFMVISASDLTTISDYPDDITLTENLSYGK